MRAYFVPSTVEPGARFLKHADADDAFADELANLFTDAVTAAQDAHIAAGRKVYVVVDGQGRDLDAEGLRELRSGESRDGAETLDRRRP